MAQDESKRMRLLRVAGLVVSRGVLAGFLFASLFGSLGACAGAGAGKSPGVDGADTSSGVDAADSASMTGTTCQTIRICVAMCADTDEACAQACVARGSPQDQAIFRALLSCTSQYCQVADFNCGCQQQCFPEGNCLAETDTCAAGVSDDLACMYCR